MLQSETTGTSTTSLLWSAVGQLPLLVSDATFDYLYGPVKSHHAPVARIPARLLPVWIRRLFDPLGI